MSAPQQTISPASNSVEWDIDLIFSALGDRRRREMFLSMARNGPQTAAQLSGRSGRLLTTILKQLAAMCKAGLVVKKENPADRRKPLYGISPDVPLTKTETGIFINFGFWTIRL